MSTPDLSIQYLVAGPCTSGKSVALKDKTLELVKNQFFGLESTNGKQTLLITDDKGILRSVNNDFSFKAQPKQHLSKIPMQLSIVPDGVTRMTYFAVEQKWQKLLVDQINAANHKFMQTIPITFSKSHLVPPEESSSKEDKDAFNAISDNVSGQLIRKIRGVFIIFSSKYFKDVDKKVTATVFDSNAKEVKVLTSDKAEPMDYTSSFNNETINKQYRLFYIDDIEYSFPEGKYRIDISSNFLGNDLQKWCTVNGTKKLTFNIEVKFSIHTLTGDFDFHQLDPLSLEEALLSQYPHRFAHITSSLIKEPSKKPEPAYQEYKTCFQTWIERAEWFKQKRELVTGFTSGELNERMQKLGTFLLDGYKISVKDDQVLSKDAQLLSDAWSAAFAIKDAKESWNKYLDQLKIAGSVKTINQSISTNWVTKTIRTSNWKKYLLNHVGDEEKPEIVIKLLDKGLTKENAALLIKDGIPKETLELDKAFLKGVGKALSVLDTAMSVYQFVNLIEQRCKLGNDYDLNNTRFVDGATKYLKKFGTRTNVQAITMLEVLRRTTDATKMKLDDNAKELLQQSLDFILGVLTCVPVVGEVAALIAAGKATIEAVANYAATVGKVIDNKLLDDYFTDIKGVFDKLAELEGEYSINMKAVGDLLNSNVKEKEPAVQFRLRAGILIGLLRLIDRCGSRINNSADFEKKFKQYDIEGYINTFILKPNSNTSITIQSDIPLDEIWLFCHGNKEGMGLIKVHRGFRFLKENAWALPALVTPTGAGVAGGAKAIQLITAPKVSLSYQRMFPIHLRSSKDALQLARIFSTNYSGVKKSNLVYSNIYIYENKTWQEIASFKGTITPLSQIRVIVILTADNSNESIAGLPISIQLVRTDTLPDTFGPVYKGLVQRLGKTECDGFDKGLLPQEEKTYPADKHFGFVLHPFYFFEDALLKGIKPCGSVYTTTLSMENKFILKIGNKPIDIKLGSSKECEFKVGLPHVSPIFNMVIRPDFLGNKTSQAILSPIFVEKISEIKVVGFFVKNNFGWVFKNSSVKELFPIIEFIFSWDKKLEIIFVFRTDTFHESAVKKNAIKFPVQVTAFEDVDWATDTAGPAYPAEAIGYKGKQFYRGNVQVKEIEGVLRSVNVLYSDDKVVNSNDQIKFDDAGFLCAVRIGFAYSVEISNGDMGSFEAFKPFAENIKKSNEFYKYYFKISAPDGIGMKNALDFDTKFNMLPLPSQAPKEMDFLLSKKFVTGSSNHTSLEIQACDYK